MLGKTNLVSIIIPAYNAAPFIEETIQSILSQTYPYWEIIIIDDGSTDNTASIINSLHNDRVKMVRQENAGVAVARNHGLRYTYGTMVVFFDADDLMSPDFLEVRVEALQNDPGIGYVGGLIETFPGETKTKKAAASDPVNEILFFDSAFATIPSNYLFKKDVLVRNRIFFNKELSSSADRFFILEVSKFAKGKNITGERGKLLYRFTSQSMSNKVSPHLIIDNEKFYYELKKKHLLPHARKQKFKSFYFLSLAKGFGMIRYWRLVIKYLAMSFINHPVFFTLNFRKRLSNLSSIKGLAKSA